MYLYHNDFDGADDFLGPGKNRLHRLLKKEEQSLYNRLRTIVLDKEYVDKVAKKLGKDITVIANLRCGLWYAPQCFTTCYFKSTDGHCNHWQFNLKRLNLHLLSIAAEKGGCIIVDATRKGKTFPDSFSRTVPIWATVMNRVLAKRKALENDENWMSLRMPNWIPASEVSQIEAILPSFVQSLEKAEAIQAELDRLSSLLQYPLFCSWISQDSDFPGSKEDSKFTNLYLVSASSATKAAMDSTYVQGGADDQESWSLGLTATLFWQNKDDLIYSSDGIPERISKILGDSKFDSTKNYNLGDRDRDRSQRITWIGSTGVGCSESLPDPNCVGPHDLIVDCSSDGLVSESKFESRLSHHPVADGKADKNKLSKMLDQVLSEARSLLPNGRVVVCSPDVSAAVCVCLALLVRFYDEKGNFSTGQTAPTKNSIKSSLIYLTSFISQSAVPPRWMLTDVNRFFLTSANNQPQVLQKWRQEQLLKQSGSV